MERKETENRGPRAGLDSPEQDSAPVTDDATRGGAEEVLGSPWWESGSALEEAAEEEPDTDTYRGTGYIYRGVRYGEPAPEPKSQPTENPGDDDDPVDLSVLAVMSEDQPAIPPAEAEEADEPLVGTPWWQAGPRPEEAAEEEPGTAHGEPAPEPKSQPTENPGDDNDSVDLSVMAEMSTDQPAVPPAEVEEADEPVVGAPWWQAGSGLNKTAEEEPGAESETEDTPLAPRERLEGTGHGEPHPEPEIQTPDDADKPVDLATPATMPADQPAAPPAEAEEFNEPIVAPPWWQSGSGLEETPEEEPGAESETEDTPLAAHDIFRRTGFGEPHPEPESQTPDDGDEPVDMATPATMSTDQPAAPLAEGGEPPSMELKEEAAVHHPEPDRELPGAPAGLPVATEGLPERPPAELIRAIVAEVCPGELLLVEADVAPLPEWALAAATAARNDLDRRSGEHTPIDAGEYLRLAIVENAMGLHDEADTHLKEALPRSDRFGPVLNALAVTSLARGKIAPAIVYCREALRETGGDDSVRAAASSNLGDLYDLQGDAARAAEAYETAIKCLQAREDPRWLSRLHLRSGRLYRRLGQADNARLHLSDSVRLFKDSGDLAGHVQSLAALGSALTESGLTDLALRNFEEAVRICLRTGDKPGAALVQDELGVAYTAQDQLTRALAYFESALWLHRELGNRKAEAATLSNMAKIHDSRGDSGEARQLYESALEIDPQVGRAGGPHPASGDQGGARAKLLQAEEILSRAESAEQQEYVQRMIEKPGTEPEGLG